MTTGQRQAAKRAASHAPHPEHLRGICSPSSRSMPRNSRLKLRDCRRSIQSLQRVCGLASGKYRTLDHLKNFVQERISDANTKADLTKILADNGAGAGATAKPGNAATAIASGSSVRQVRGSATSVRKNAAEAGSKLGASKFSPEVLEEARHEIRAASELASTFERPGRYFAQYGDQNEYMPSRSTNAAKG